MFWWALWQLKMSRYSWIRAEAAEKLGKYKGGLAVKALVSALKNDRHDVRLCAATALGRIGDVQAIEPLVAALKDSDRHVRQRAAWALHHLKWQPASDTQQAILAIADQEWDEVVRLGAPAVEPLVAALKKWDSHVQQRAAEALGKIGDARAIQPLVSALKAYDKDVRRSATEALGNIGEAAVEPLVAAIMDSDRNMRQCAAWVLHRLKWQPADDTQRAVLAIADQEWDKAVRLGVAAVEPLVAMLKNSDWDMRQSAAEALGKIGDARAVQPLLSLTKDSEVAGEAAQAMQAILRNAVASVATETLLAVTDLAYVVHIHRETDGCGGHRRTGEAKLDCGQLRQLARQELIRRGTQA